MKLFIYYICILIVVLLYDNNAICNCNGINNNNNNVDSKLLIDNSINLSNNDLNNFNNLLVYKNRYLVLGGENVLLKLDINTFEIIESIRYGPFYDTNQCKYYPKEECIKNSINEKRLTNNYNKLLILKQQQQNIKSRLNSNYDEYDVINSGDDEDLLITCWTSYQGVCDMRSINNLNKLITSSTIPSVANDAFNSTFAYITLSPSLQEILLVASTYNNNGPFRDDIPAIAGRSLQFNNRNTASTSTQTQSVSSIFRSSSKDFMQIISNNNQGLKETKSSIEFMSRQVKTFIVKYVYGFKTKFYNYFLTLQHLDAFNSQSQQTQPQQLIQTKIVRFCQNDLSFIKTYVEMPIKCESNDVSYNELINARLVEYKINKNAKISYLIGLFQETKRYTMQNISDLYTKKPIKQAICIYKLNSINKMFLMNVKSCLNNDINVNQVIMRGLNYIKPDQICRSSSSISSSMSSIRNDEHDKDDENNETSENIIDNEQNDNYCQTIDSINTNLYPIGGQISLKTNLIYELSNKNTSNENDDDNTDVIFNHLNIKFFNKNTAMLVLLSNLNNQVKYYRLNLNQANKLRFISKLNLNKQSTLLTRPLSIEKPLTNLEFNTNKTKVFLINKNFIYKINLPPLNQDEDDVDEATSSGEGVNGGNDSIIVINNLIKQKWIEFNVYDSLDVTYKCLFKSQSFELLILDAIRVSMNQIKCSLPHETQLEKLFNSNENNALNMYLMRDNEYLFNKTIKFIICNKLTSCVQCLLRQNYCKWSSNRCLNSIETIENNDIVSNIDQCSQFNVNTNRLLIPYTPNARQKIPITFELRNFNAFDTLVCILDLKLNTQNDANNNNLTVKFKYLNQTHSQCMLEEFFQQNIQLFKLNTGKLDSKLRLYDLKSGVFVDTPNTQLELNFYVCELLASTCGDCLNLKKYYSCSWCSYVINLNHQHDLIDSRQQCKFIPLSVNRVAILHKLYIETQQCLVNETSDDSVCLNVNYIQQQQQQQVISSVIGTIGAIEVIVKPTKIPLGGGSILTISSLNADLSQYVNISLCNQQYPCLVVDTTTNEIKCKTSSVDVEHECNVAISLNNGKLMTLNNVKINYVDVKIDSIKPNELIQSCKECVLNIYGKNLDAGVYRSIRVVDTGSVDSITTSTLASTGSVDDVSCDIISINRTKIKCKLVTNFNLLGKKNLIYEIDKQMKIVNYQLIRVSANPLIISINQFNANVNNAQRKTFKESLVNGGIKFELQGYNFNLVQKFQTLVSFNGRLYKSNSYKRLTNERLVLKYPKLDISSSNEVVSLSKPTKYTVNNIGFLMDNYNQTLTNIEIFYYKLPKIIELNLFQVETLNLLDNGLNEKLMIIKFKDVDIVDVNEIQTKFKYDLDIYVLNEYLSYCYCDFKLWLNNTYLTCKFINQNCYKTRMNAGVGNNLASGTSSSSSSSGDGIILNDDTLIVNDGYEDGDDDGSIEGDNEDDEQLMKIRYLPSNINSQLDLIRLFIGNLEIIQQQSTQNTQNDVLDAYLKQIQLKQHQLRSSYESNMNNNMNINRIILISTSFLLVILFLALIIIIAVYYKRKFYRMKSGHHRGLSSDHDGTIGGNMDIDYKNCNKLTLIQFHNSNNTSGNDILTKLLLKINYLENNLNLKCKSDYDKIKIEFLNEFNLNLIYNGIPMYAYKQYLLNVFQLAYNRNLILNHQIQIPKYINNNNNNNSSNNGSVFYATIKSSFNEPNTASAYAAIAANGASIITANTSNNNNNNGGGVGTISSSSSIYNLNKIYNKNQYDAMVLFSQLINNKIFLNIFLTVLNKQDNFINKDRQQFTSLIVLFLKTNLSYLYTIIKAQLSEQISTQQQGDQSVFMNKTPLVEYLVHNWLSLFMYQHINDNLSIKFYRLFKIIKYQLESGPVDACLNMAKYCLNENYLLKLDETQHQQQQFQYKKMFINLVNSLHNIDEQQSQQQQPILIFKTYFILDCDTIKQCKEKFLDFLYKNLAYSQRPSLNDVDLELYLLNSELIDVNNESSVFECLLLSNRVKLKEFHDNNGSSSSGDTNEKHQRLLMIKDYCLNDGAYINITHRPIAQQLQQQQQQQHSQGQYNTQQLLTLKTATLQNRKLIFSNYPSTTIQHPSSATMLFDKNYSVKSNKYIKYYHLQKPNDLLMMQSATLITTTSASASVSSQASPVSTQSATNTKTKSFKLTKKFKLLKTNATKTIIQQQQASCGASTTSSSSSSSTSSYSDSCTDTTNAACSTNTSNLNNCNGVKASSTATAVASSFALLDNDESNIKLTRLLLIKGTLQPFIDDLFETIFTNTTNLPPIIKHLFDYIDNEYAKFNYNNTCNTTTSTTNAKFWKNNIYFMKFWLNLIKNPQLLFDINKTQLIDASLQSIGQLFSDICSFNDNLFNTKDLNTNRLIFSNDILRYKPLIDNFYNEIQSYPHISDHELHFYLNEFSKCQTSDLNSIEILLNLYDYYEKYEKQINEMLGQQQCSILLPLHHKLVQIKDLMLNQQETTNQQSQEQQQLESNQSTPILFNNTSNNNNNNNSTSFLLDHHHNHHSNTNSTSKLIMTHHQQSQQLV